MLQHIVLFRLKPEATDAQIDAAMNGLRGLATIIPEIEEIEVRRDVVGRPVSATFGLVSSFADAEALRQYNAHPQHVAAVDAFRALIESYLVLDYGVDA